MDWYILFTKTGSEAKVEKILKKNLDSSMSVPFIPLLETLFRYSGRIKKEIKPLFPGYVFIESELSSVEIINNTRSIISASNDIFCFLKYEDTGDIAMKEQEREMLLRLSNDECCIESSSGIIVGDHVIVKEGALKGMESIIRKIYRHKRRAIIELEFMGALRQISVALEIVEKI